MIKKRLNIFGEESLKIFENGDLISYTTLEGNKVFGIIIKIFLENIENDKNRKCAFAEIKNMYGDTVQVILLSIKLESKVNGYASRDEKETGDDTT